MAGLSAFPWALRSADADQAEVCCFRRCCPEMHGQLDRQRKFQGLNHGPQMNHDPELNHHLSEMEISASHRFPACEKAARRAQTIATSQN